MPLARGTRFGPFEIDARGPATEINVVLDWFRDLETALSAGPGGGRR